MENDSNDKRPPEYYTEITVLDKKEEILGGIIISRLYEWSDGIQASINSATGMSMISGFL